MPVSEKEIIERLPDWIAEKKTSFLFGSGTSAPGMPLMNMFPGKKDGSTDVDGLMYEIINEVPHLRMSAKSAVVPHRF